ncbi:VOC family protein [Bacillus sp. FJAT-49736]|uniref:VOC family protein n=1 Tax=Bacillus sp. FJAT-49736 TaxID=2833582 RepID=UPI001BCA33C3|nr:VOC family protein [Bacillus sp. FJAT-49736]MBS4174945.1 VOC family protein [Bacillus sp. FJAT-49736]
MNKIIPRLIIENCKEAIEYYAEVFNAEIKNIQLADGVEMFKGHEGKYIHAELHLNENYAIYFNDIFGNESNKGTNIIMGIDFESEEEIRNVYEKLSKDGKVTMELQLTFWNALYGKVTDKYGIHWELNYQR